MYPTVIKLSTVSKHRRLAQLINYSDFKFVAKNYSKIKIFYVSSYFRTVVGDSLAAFGDFRRPCPLHGCFPRKKKEYFYHGRTPVKQELGRQTARGGDRCPDPRDSHASRTRPRSPRAHAARCAHPCLPARPARPRPLAPGPAPRPHRLLQASPQSPPPLPPRHPPHPRPYRAVPETQRPDPFLHLPSHRNRKPPAPALGGRPGSGDHFVAARREGVAVSARHLDEKGSGGGGCGRRTGTPSRCSKLTSSTPTPCKPSSRPPPSSLPVLIPAPPHIPCRFCSSSLVRAHALLVSLSASVIERVLGGFGGAASRRRRLLGLLPGLRNAAAREGDRLTDRAPVRPPPLGSVVVVALSVHARVAKRQ